MTTTAVTTPLHDLIQYAGAVPTLSPEQLSEAKALQIRETLARDRITLYHHGQAAKVWKGLVEAAQQSPTTENFNALEQAGSRGAIEAMHHGLRQVAKRVLKDVLAKETTPFLLPILQSVHAELSEAVAILLEKDISLRSQFPSLQLLEPSPVVASIVTTLKQFENSIASLAGTTGSASVETLLNNVGVSLDGVPLPAGAEQVAEAALAVDPATVSAAASAYDILEREALANGGGDPGIFPE